MILTLIKSFKTEKKWLVNNTDNKRLTLISSKEYDSEGRLISSFDYSTSGVLNKQVQILYQQNSSIENACYYDTKGLLDSLFKSTSILDLSGNVIQKTTLDDTGDTVAYNQFVYDNSGKIIKSIALNTNGSIKNVINFEYNYNSSGKLIERIQTPENSTSFIQKDILTYSDNNLRIDKQEINSTGKVDLVYTFIYNYFGLVSKEIQKSVDGSILYSYEYEYTYYN